MIDQMYLMLYNLVFTSLPPLIIGVYDKTIHETLLFTRPYLYRYVSKSHSLLLLSKENKNKNHFFPFSVCYIQSRLGLAYQPHSFWITMLDALYQSLVIFFVAEAAYSESDVDVGEFGTTITTSCLITMLVHGAIEIKSWVRYYTKRNFLLEDRLTIRFLFSCLFLRQYCIFYRSSSVWHRIMHSQ